MDDTAAWSERTNAPFRAVSMTDVAQRAGVSQKTVSRVVNGEPNVTDPIRERVDRAIHELGFRPNAAARALKSQRSRRIGMLTLGTALHGPMSVLSGVERATRLAGYSLSVVRTDEAEPESLQPAVDALVGEGVEAIIISEPADQDLSALRVPEGIAVLTFGGSSASDHARTLMHGVDEAGGVRSATEHLLALGHETVWHISGPTSWTSTTNRLDGWRTALRDADAAEPPVLEGDWGPRSGFEAMSRIVHRPDVTAVFAANDQMAVGAMAAIRAAGLRVPEDISVVGFDDEPIARYLPIPLTTVRQDIDESTRVAMHRLFRFLEGHPPAESERIVPATLVVRASTAPPAPGRGSVRPVH
jgi:DNA-binding LacI/PurR family transcriptional regulator